MENGSRRNQKQGHIYPMPWTALHWFGEERPEGTWHEVSHLNWQAI